MKRTILALLLIVAISPIASAQDNRGVIISQIDAAASLIEAEGFVRERMGTDARLIGSLADGARVEVELNFDGVRSYVITGVCDYGCDDLDLSIRSYDGEVIDSDYLVDDTPIVTVTPETRGPHLLRIDMASCNSETCLFGLTMHSREE